MLTYLRYALATFCFAASVGCLALRGWSYATRVSYIVDVESGEAIFEVRTWTVAVDYQEALRFGEVWRDGEADKNQGHFEGSAVGGLYARFPLWYAALVSALAGIAALRLGRRFTLRSAIIATTVVAGLLGMAVIL